VFAVSPKDGQVLWTYEGWSCIRPIPHPVAVNENTLFITSGYDSISSMIQVNDGKTKELWKTEAAATQIGQPVLVNDHLFVGGTVKNAKGGLVCINLKGEVQWDAGQIDGAPKFSSLNMVVADGMLIALDGNSGMLHLIEASPKEFKELASAKVVAEKGQTWAPLALSDGKLLVRDHSVMKCLSLK
jgi:outer membrane protein assembly factor BamB